MDVGRSLLQKEQWLQKPLAEVVPRNRKDAQAEVAWGGKLEVAVSEEERNWDVELVAVEKNLKVEFYLEQAELGKLAGRAPRKDDHCQFVVVVEQTKAGLHLGEVES